LHERQIYNCKNTEIIVYFKRSNRISRAHSSAG
jgi:hypothetical protein